MLLIICNKYFFKNKFLTRFIDFKTHVEKLVVESRDIKCLDSQITIKVADGVVCREKLPESTWLDIFDSYQIKSKGKDKIYSFMDKGNLRSANELLNNNYDLDRFENYEITDQEWDEDPYNDRYWRFLYYSLRPLNDLLNIGIEKGDPRYIAKMVSVYNSFIDQGLDREIAWSDYHSVAFRAMNFNNLWWKLRENNLLSAEFSEKMLIAIKKHGDFLVDNNHYEPGHNHGITESSALLLLASSFPDLDEEGKWMTSAKLRLSQGLENIIDDEGVLVENSPYYQFYALEKYWEIYKFTQAQNILIDDKFEEKIGKMVSYSTHILQPDGEIPLIGASLKRKYYSSGIYREISEKYPELLYVLSSGKKGEKPKIKNIKFASSGQSILRSDFGDKNEFVSQTQLILNNGRYRSEHNDLDSLSIVLFGEGQPLIVDSGLYTYLEGPMNKYFRSTTAHNTVVVDGKSQDLGVPMTGEIVEGDGFVYQNGQNNLYPGVTHNRAVAMLGSKYILVVDEMTSDRVHQYDQMFHLFPGAVVKQNDMSLEVTDGHNNQKLHFTQVIDDGLTTSLSIGETSPMAGMCSQEYGKMVPCYEIKYGKSGTNTKFLTLIEIGKKDTRLSLVYDQNTDSLSLATGKENYKINIKKIMGEEEVVEIANKEWSVKSGLPIEMFTNQYSWKVLSGGKEVADSQPYLSLNPFTIKVPSSGKSVAIEKYIPLNLSNNNMQIKMMVKNAANVKNIDLKLSTSDSCFARTNLKNSYRDNYEREWLTIGIGKGEMRSNNGNWTTSGDCFDWSKINKVSIISSSKGGKSGEISLANLAVTNSKDARVIIVFDDGYESILPATKIMNDLGIAGNVAVIGSYTNEMLKGYLNLNQLKLLKNDYGFDIINHSYHHKNSMSDYYPHNLEKLENDIIDGLKYLTNVGLNPNPNWYVYPNGETNFAVKKIIGKYYKFARVNSGQPEVYPFGDNLAVKAYPVNNNTSPYEVMRAINDAKKYKLTLFLTFHRIHSKESDLNGYKLADFEKIMNHISSTKIKTVTLSQFDSENSVTSTQINIKNRVANQLVLEIKKQNLPLIKLISNKFEDIGNE